MDLLQLRYFYESAMAESFSKTAQKYMVPASSVSASVRRLEQELGVKLFIRTGNRVLLNEKGMEFLSSVSQILTQLDMSVSTLSTAPAKKQTISILARSTRETVVRWIVRFYRAHPSVFFKLTFDDTPDNYGKYDIIISSPGEGLDDYESFHWRKYRIRVEALESDPLCGGNVTLSQLKDRLFVTTNSQRGGFKVFEQACQRNGFTPKVFLECDDYDCRGIPLLSGICLGLNLGNEEDSRQSRTRFLKVTDFTEDLAIRVYYKKEVYNGDIKLFLDLLKSSSPKL